LAIHASLVAARLHPGDQVSVSWVALGGWPFVLLTGKWNALLIAAPSWVVAVVVPLMLLGVAAWPGPLGTRMALISAGYTAAFLAVGRPDNFLWGVVTAPLLGLGLLMVPGALRDICAALRPATTLSSTART
jgi:hypothetical protein